MLKTLILLHTNNNTKSAGEAELLGVCGGERQGAGGMARKFILVGNLYYC